VAGGRPAGSSAPGDWLRLVGPASPPIITLGGTPAAPTRSNSAPASQPEGHGAITPLRVAAPTASRFLAAPDSSGGEAATAAPEATSYVSGGSGGSGGTVFVSISATDNSAAEIQAGDPPNPGEFTFTRSMVMSSALTVAYTVGGTATSGNDYAPLTRTVIIPANVATATVAVDVADDLVVETSETVVANVVAGTGYMPSGGTTATVTIADNDVMTILAKRTAGGPVENAYPIKSGEHFDISSTFNFELTGLFNTPSHGWDLWADDATGTYTALAQGTGAQFSYTFQNVGATPGNIYVRFYGDANNNGAWDYGELRKDSNVFWVQTRKVYDINVDVSSALPAGVEADVPARLSGAADLLLKKDSADDYRSAVTFNMKTVNRFTATGASGARPDPVPDETAQRLKHYNAAADIVFVQDLENAAGITGNKDWHQIIIDWDDLGPDGLEVLIAHEMGHGVGLSHSGTAAPWVMWPGPATGVENQVSAAEADAYD